MVAKIIIRTFGGFDIIYNEKALSDKASCRGKMWLILKFLIAHHKKSVVAEDLIDLLWPDDTCKNPAASLNTMVCRLRKTLTDLLGDIHFIDYAHGKYSWNPPVDCMIDTAEFERNLTEARDKTKSDDERIKKYKYALSLYTGDFLRGESNETWLMNFVNYYRRLYYSGVDELAGLYEQQAAYEEAVNLYVEAIKMDPYEETLYERQIRLLIHLGEYKYASSQYVNIAKILKREFDAEPSAALKDYHREISKFEKKHAIDLNDVKQLLDSNIKKKTAIICGPEAFERIYCYDMYLDERMQFPVFLAMITVQPDEALNGNKEKLRLIMKVLRQKILMTLRQCDIVCQYSSNQYILMLTAADEEHKTVPLTRIRKLFEKDPESYGIALHSQVLTLRNNKIHI